MFHIADAPPHGRLYVDSGDNSPDGCKCGITIETIAKLMEDKQIQYKLLKACSKLERMPEVFKKHIKRYDECSLKDASEVFKAVTETIKVQTREF